MIPSSNPEAMLVTFLMGIVVILFLLKYAKTEAIKSSFGNKKLIKFHQSNQNKLALAPKPKLALITDLDHTLFGLCANKTHEECNEYIEQFNRLWIDKYAPNDCVLIYATGRNFEKYQLAAEQWGALMVPDILVSADGVSIHWFNQALSQKCAPPDTLPSDFEYWNDASYENELCRAWNQEVAERIHDEAVEKFELLKLPKGSRSKEPFRIGLLCKGHKLAKEIEAFYAQRVKEYNKESGEQMEIHSFLAIERYMKEHDDAFWSAMTPKNAGKGSAVEFLRKKLKMDREQMIVCGDSGNDISMIGLDGYNAVIMKNSSCELLGFYEKNKEKLNMIKTRNEKTLGVIEGLEHYGRSLLDPEE